MDGVICYRYASVSSHCKFMKNDSKRQKGSWISTVNGQNNYYAQHKYNLINDIS